MLGILKTGLNLSLKNWSTLLLFEILYKILGAGLVADLSDFLLAYVLRISKVPFISQANLRAVLRNPAADLLLIFVFILFAGYVYFEIAALILCCEAGWQNRRISLWKLTGQAFRRVLRCVHYKNLLALLLLVPILSLSFLPLTDGALKNFRMPEFILEYIHGAPAAFLLFATLLILLHVLLFFFLFGFPYVILENRNFISSWHTSLELLRGRIGKTVFYLFSCLLLQTGIALLAAGTALFAAAGYMKLFVPAAEAGTRFARYYGAWKQTAEIVYGVFLSASLSAFLVTLFHSYRKELRPAVPETQYPFRTSLIRLSGVLLSILFLFFFRETEVGGNLIFPEQPDIKIVAHRAGSLSAPENTLAALRTAIGEGASMAEIDVRQTKDGVLIVLHDSDFKRTTGWNHPVWDTDYRTVKNLDAGSFFSPDFAREPIPTLDAMLKAAKGRISLMIELKSTGKERNLEESVLRLIHENGMERQCTVASMNPDILKRLKELDPDIHTTFITAVLYSSLYDLSYVDAYSVETTFLSRIMVEAAHFQQKEIYAWTANKEENIKKIIRCGADGLVTDNPKTAASYLNSLNQDPFLNRLTELFFPNEKTGTKQQE